MPKKNYYKSKDPVRLKRLREDHPRFGMRWTAKEMWKLCELYVQPIPWTTIARKMERTIASCQNRMFIIRLAFEIHQDKDAQKIIEKLESSKAVKHALV